ncbi:MAG TPA: hypothetical protein VK996_09095, partial [Ramlibacter sp.]|nr:hypothetical protein [Ramlibacter sp.]
IAPQCSMTNREVSIDDHKAALEKERKLWHKVLGKGPLSPDFDPPLFEKWLAAVGHTAMISKVLRSKDGERPSPEFEAHPS